MLEELMLPKWMLPALKPSFLRAARRARQFSMVGWKRMQNIWRLINRVERRDVKGDFIELGVARGGTAILIATLAQRSKTPREVWFYDAFEDFTPPRFFHKDVARLLFEEEKFDARRVHLVKGFFNESVAAYPGRPIAFMHVDASGYEPAKQCLEPLLPLVSRGGYVVLDNYGVDEGCRMAAHEALDRFGSGLSFTRFGRTQVYMQRL